ncbi:hypothetical protein [Aureimonas pseudogalii]|uniref:Uncharacterized protein n=1 Tax=Aureimonas pseudogalii TaxID=1744844 RepID=A0A7W6H8A3_9HYPH|nr:hypothetical protein [Aureimonas pseudogalii]MBB4000253.1 hypothetical protein [Aureimonas pseudogalii]
MRKDIPCVPGKREFSSGRYFIAEIHDPRSMTEAYERFVLALQRRETVAGLFVISEQVSLGHEASASDQFRQCAELMREISDLPPEALANGGRLGKTVELDCPVTGVSRSFDDFDAVAFVPRSLDESDPLYDPMMGAPVSCINFSSDIYAFAMFTRDIALRLKKSEVSNLGADDRREVFAYASKQWQIFARATIRNYISITNIQKCPVSLSDDDSVWNANHQDPAFAENHKQQYAHHMPLLYAPRIVTAWEQFFETGYIENQSVETITPFGFSSSLQYEQGLRL